MKAKSIKGKSPEEIAALVVESKADGFTPTLAIVFMSIQQNIEAVSAILDRENITIFGATTAGEFIDGEVSEESIVVMLLDIKREFFKVAFDAAGEKSTREIARQIGESGLKSFAHPAFIVSGSGVKADGEKIVCGIEETAGTDVTIFGGMAGDDFMMTKTCVFTNRAISDNGIVALIVDEEKIKLKGLATCGWKAVGTVKTITKSEGCWVYTIDNEPALDVIIKFLGIYSLDKNKNNDVIINVGANFPLQLQREKGNSIMRTAMLGNWEDRSFMCAGNVPQGSKVRFSLPPDFDVIDEVITKCSELKEEENEEADALIMFSCKARHVALGPLVSEEIEGVKNVWNAPLAGFFTYGEFGRATEGRQEFHNITCCWVALKEGEP